MEVRKEFHLRGESEGGALEISGAVIPVPFGGLDRIPLHTYRDRVYCKESTAFLPQGETAKLLLARA